MDRRIFARVVVVLAVAAGVWFGVAPASAEESDRTGRWQFQIPMTYVDSEEIEGDGGTSLDLNGDLGWGFGFGYNMDEKWYLGVDFTWMDASYTAELAFDDDGDTILDGIERFGGTLDASTVHFVAQYNFRASTITPFLRAGVGSTYIDSNIAAGPTQGYCWWYPWYGYVCDYYTPTYGNNAFSYSGALGVRGDITDTFYLEGSINQSWIDADNTDTIDLTSYRLNVGWIF